MIGFIGKAAGYVAKKSLPYAFVFTLGAIAGSGVLSEQENPDYIQQQKGRVLQDEAGKRYVIEEDILKPVDNHQKGDSNLVELLK